MMLTHEAAFQLLSRHGNVGTDPSQLMAHKPTEAQLRTAFARVYRDIESAERLVREWHEMPNPREIQSDGRNGFDGSGFYDGY